MADLRSLTAEALKQTGEQRAAEIAAALNRCCETTFTLRFADEGRWSAEDAAEEFRGPGLALTFQIGAFALRCLFPVTMPLPDVARDAGSRSDPRLQALADAWSHLLFPGNVRADSSTAEWCESLSAAVTPLQVGEPARTVVLELVPAEERDSDEVPARLLLVWPVAGSLSVGSLSVESGELEEENSGSKHSTLETQLKAHGGSLRPLLGVPVQVSVRVVEKRVEVDNVLKLTPGALIRFNKSCEDLLDLYVNNHRYCRGEAVKVGEKFGFRVTEVDVKPQYVRRVIDR